MQLSTSKITFILLQDEEDLFQYFTSACFSGFGDGPRAFYGACGRQPRRLHAAGCSLLSAADRRMHASA